MPKVSVIVPVYNVEKYIAETIDSVLAQTFTDFELIIIDDESKDRSIAICQGIADPRIHIIHQKNRGLAGARNTGIRHAQG
ncbi:MAG: glycosyltransferase family 2 protein, partial [Pseudanabaena sp.]